MSMWVPPWIVGDGLWLRVEPLLPKRARRFRYPGRRPLDDRLVLQGILFVLHTGIGWEHLPQELGFGCGMTAWRRLRDWQQAGVWERLHELLLAECGSDRERGCPAPQPLNTHSCGYAPIGTARALGERQRGPSELVSPA